VRPEALPKLPSHDHFLGKKERTRDVPYTRDDSALVEDEEDSYWTTVFGFPPGEVDQVISYFRRLGPLDEVRQVENISFMKGGEFRDGEEEAVPAGPTWIHLRWHNRIDAEKAHRRQGTILRSYSRNQLALSSFIFNFMTFRGAKGLFGNGLHARRDPVCPSESHANDPT
jgi:Nup53/35/40-type RNA recognition motif